MDPIFDRSGKFVGWLKGDAVIDPSGKYRAFASHGLAFDYNARYLGRLSRGYFWDSKGNAVAFASKASGGPARPRTGTVPPLPVLGLEPRRPSVPPTTPPAKPLRPQWSEFSWDDFLRARASEP